MESSKAGDLSTKPQEEDILTKQLCWYNFESLATKKKNTNNLICESNNYLGTQCIKDLVLSINPQKPQNREVTLLTDFLMEFSAMLE